MTATSLQDERVDRGRLVPPHRSGPGCAGIAPPVLEPATASREYFGQCFAIYREEGFADDEAAWRACEHYVAALSPAQPNAEVERLRNALQGLLNAQTSRERAYATMEAQAALSEERPQVSDAPAQAAAQSESHTA